MANTAAIANSFKAEILKGEHNLDGTDVIKAALYLATATMDKTATAYTATNEVSGTGYTAGGVTVTNATAPALDGDVAHWTPSANISFGTVTLGTAFDAVLLYNDTHLSDAAIGVYTFGSTTVTAGTFTLNVPTNDGTTGLLRIT